MREGRGWWESIAWGVLVIARDTRVWVVVVGDGEDVVARRRHVRVCRRRTLRRVGVFPRSRDHRVRRAQRCPRARSRKRARTHAVLSAEVWEGIDAFEVSVYSK